MSIDLTPKQEKELQKELQDCPPAPDGKPGREAEQKIHSYFKDKLNQSISTTKAKELANRFVTQANYFRTQFKERTTTAIIAAFSFIIAFSWQDLIVNVIKTYTKTALLEQYPYLAQLFTAIIVTIIAVFAIMIVSNWSNKK